MRANFLPFSRPAISEDTIAAVSSVLRSGWITTGPKTAEFERAFAASVGAGGAVALGSATAGMHLALHALDLKAGDEVITPSLTWVSTPNMIVLAGARPVFVDVDRDALIVTPASIEAAITERTRLIIPVHFAGAAADMPAIRAVARRHGIPVMEDAAHALGTACSGAPVGREGTAIFSFHPSKNMTTGEGGMFCSDDEALLDRVRTLKFHGLGVDAYDREKQGRSPQAQVQEPGFKYNMTDISAAIGLGQLADLPAMNARRQELATYYREQLKTIEELAPLSVSPCTTEHAWHLMVVRLLDGKHGLSRDQFIQKLKECNIGTGIHFRAVHTQSYYREQHVSNAWNLPNTEWNSDRICSLPLFPDMTERDVDDVIDAVKDVLATGA